MTTQDRGPSLWAKLPILLRAITSGLLLTLAAVNVWPLLLLNLGVPLAAFTEAIFLGLFLWWTSGGGPPRTTGAARATAFRRGRLSPTQWFWGVIAALFFAATIHASIVLLFRFVSFPMAAFRRGYDISFIPSQPLRWLAVVVSAASAGICEETGFRGYMQRPIERRHGAPVAILISSLFFMALHLTKAWATPGMVPIVFGAGVLLGLLAWSSGSLIPGMIGHVVMDVGLFAYWWTGIAGDFTARPITDTGVDGPFVIACAAFTVSLFMVLFAISRLRRRAQIPGTRNKEFAQSGPSAPIIAVALVQFLGSLPFLYLCGIALWGTIWVTHELANSPTILIVVFGLPFLFSLTAVVTSIGLLRLREWARRATLYLATLPVSGCALFLILYHPRDVYGAPFAVRDITHPVGKVLLAILIPVSIWWWVLFTRESVRSQFRRNKADM